MRGCAELLALAAAALGCVAALLFFNGWKPDAGMARIFGDAPAGAVETAVLLGYVLISAAVSEELIFRHYLLNRLLAIGGGGVWTGWRGVGRAMPAILLATALWTLGHGGMIEPAWLKYAQIGVYGIALGVAQIRLGTEASVTLHLLFNAATPAMAAWLAG